MRLILALLLLALPAPAWAEWVKIGSTDQVDFYYDPHTIRKLGATVRVWLLDDVTDDALYQKFDAWSMRVLAEYDCKKMRYRVLWEAYYSERMAEGKLTGERDDPSKWQDDAPGGLTESIQKIVCK